MSHIIFHYDNFMSHITFMYNNFMSQILFPILHILIKENMLSLIIIKLEPKGILPPASLSLSQAARQMGYCKTEIGKWHNPHPIYHP